MLFQDSLGVDIREDQVVIAYLKGSFKGAKLAAHSAYNLEKDRPLKDKLGTVNTLIADFRREHRVNGTDIFLGIPQSLAMFREIEFPLAVRENLRATLTYEMEKYVPLPVEDIYFDHQIISEDRAGNRLRVLLVVVKKTAMAPYIDLCRTLNGGISGIEIASTALANCLAYASDDKKGTDSRQEAYQTVHKTQNTEGQLNTSDFSSASIPSPELAPAFGLALKGLEAVPLLINLLPSELRKKPSRIGYYVMIGLSVLVVLAGLAWGGSYLLRQRMAAEELNAEMKRLRAEVSEIDRIRESISVVESRVNQLNALNQEYVPMLDIIRELTQIIPETAWVQDFSLSEKGGQLSGYAESASELIGLLESSPLFKDVVFLSTIVKDKDGKERFRIGFNINAASE